MSFADATPSQRPEVLGAGNPNAKIMIVGDCPDAQSLKERRPFAGPRETVLEGSLHQAGLTKSEVYMTNLIKDDMPVEKYWKGQTNSRKIVKDIDGYKDVLQQEITSVKPEVIVTLDELPTYVLTGHQSIVKVRGYPFLAAPEFPKCIIVPALHPAKMIWSNYIWRNYLSHDLSKARELSKNPADIWQPEIEVKIPSTFEEAKQYLDHVAQFDPLSIDIEVANYEVSCIGFATTPITAFSIPFDMRWTPEEEVYLWTAAANILGNPNITKIGQNFIFDIHFLAYRMDIITRGPIIDTMMSHSILYPDFLKSLNFLGSIYTKQRYWKDMVKFKDPKKES